MAYIGRGTDSISNVEVLDNITFSGASSYTLQKGSSNYVPISAANILVSIDGVVQANNFSVSGSTIDFGVAIANTSTCNFVLHFGTGLITTVQDGAITTVKIGNDAVTYAKLQNLATANRVLGSTSTGLIGETQIATAMVSDDAITYAKMQDTSAANRVLGAASAGTVGEVQVATDMIADAQVDESKLKISNAPTNGYFLSAQSGGSGGMTWAQAGGGGMDLLQSVTPSSTPSFILVGDFSSTYRAYKLVLAGIRPVNNNSDMTFQLQTAGGSLATSAYYWSINGQQNGSSVFESGNNETQARYFSNFSNADGGMAVEMLITNPFLAERTVFSGFCGGKRENSDHGFPQNFSAIHYTATSYTKLKIAGTQNSFTWADTGKILLYGLKES